MLQRQPGDWRSSNRRLWAMLAELRWRRVPGSSASCSRTSLRPKAGSKASQSGTSCSQAPSPWSPGKAPSSAISPKSRRCSSNRGVAKHQKDRAEAKAAHAAANAPHVKYTPERIYATQVEPRSRQRQRILVGWQGHPQTKTDAKELTWQAVSDFERPVGPFRAYEVLLLDPFVSAVAASPDGSTRGWPFKKVGNGNDKYIWIHPSTPAALATYIRTHPTTTMLPQCKQDMISGPKIDSTLFSNHV